MSLDLNNVYDCTKMLCLKGLRRSHINSTVSLTVVNPWVSSLVCLLGFSSGRHLGGSGPRNATKSAWNSCHRRGLLGRLPLSKDGGERQQLRSHWLYKGGQHMSIGRTCHLLRQWKCVEFGFAQDVVLNSIGLCIDFPPFTSCLLLSRAILIYGDLRVKKSSLVTNTPSK